jgi:hypothetical protein
MNKNCVISLPIAEDTKIAAFTRVKLDENGQVVVADAGDKAIGHTELDVDGSNGRPVCDVYRTNGGGSHYAIASEAFTPGQEFEGADDGEIAVLDAGTAEGQALEAGDGTIRVLYY